MIAFPDIILIALPGQLVYMFPHRYQMLLQCQSSFVGIFRIDVIDISRERYFRVDHHLMIFSTGITDNDIRTHLPPIGALYGMPLFVPQSFLYEIFPIFFKSRFFENTFQYHLPPVTLYFGISTQSMGQLFCLRTYGFAPLYQFFNLFFQRKPLASLIIISFFHGLFKSLQTLFQGIEYFGETFVVHLGKTLRFLLQYLVSQYLELVVHLLPDTLDFLFLNFHIFGKHLITGL